MSSIYAVLEEFLNEEDWPFEMMEEHSVLRFGFSGEHANLTCYAQFDDENEQALVYVCPPNTIDEGKRMAVAEFITRANYGMRIGNFELDMEDGEFRYKCSIDVEGGELTVQMVRNLLGAAVTTVDRYYPGLMAVHFGGTAPAEAIRQVERPAAIPDEL